MEPFESASQLSSPTSATARVWPAVLLVALYWGVIVALYLNDAAISTTFVSSVLASMVLTLLFSLWWLVFGRVGWTERLAGLAMLLGGALVTTFVSHPSVGGQGVLYIGLPLVVSVWTLWLAATKRRSPPLRLGGAIVLMAIVWLSQVVVRVDGIDGDNKAALSPRWSPSVEDRYVLERSKSNTPGTPSDEDLRPVVVQPGDWTEFRGPNRQGEVHDVRIGTDWSANPPKEIWRRPIGPSWSSVLIVDGRLFTEEQRGEEEVLVALDAATGRELWAHIDQTRFSDGQAGAGPRGTPTFVDGRLYSYGATGVLNCVDAATGKLRWTHDVAAETKGPLPIWGFSSSPLVADNLVVVFAGGQPDKGLAAYRADSGEPAWTATTGPISYSSAQFVTIDDTPQILIFSDAGLSSVNPADGKPLWEFAAPGTGIWRVDQPRQLDGNSILLGCEDLGLLRLQVKHEDGKWTAEETWRSRAMRPAYNDFIISDGVAYGFDEAIFTAVDLETGKRLWKAGRYGHGQVLLIADQKILLVISEAGEAVLVAANPKRHEELGRFSAVSGKTWNHPVIAHNRLYIRNDHELACFELAAPPVEAAEAQQSSRERDRSAHRY